MTAILHTLNVSPTTAILRPTDLDVMWSTPSDRAAVRWDAGRLRHLLAAVGDRPVILEVQNSLAFTGRLKGQSVTLGYGTPTLGLESDYYPQTTYYSNLNLGIVVVLDDGRDEPFKPKWNMIDTWREECSAALRAAEVERPTDREIARLTACPTQYGVQVVRYVDERQSNAEPQRLRMLDHFEIPLGAVHAHLRKPDLPVAL